MKTRVAFVDDQLIAREFNSGDVVRRAGYRDFVLSPYVGRVLYANPDTGKVHVQWPFGWEEVPATELVKDVSASFQPPMMADQMYSTHEMSRNINSPEVVEADKKWRKSLAAEIVDRYENYTMPLYRAACEAWHCEMSELEAFTKMAQVFGPTFGQDAVRITVGNLYELGRRLALYWKDPKRRYKTTQREKQTGKLECPRCHSALKPRVYRHGGRVMLCKGCGFAIHPRDIAASRK
jgi:hypothetical protein